MGRLALPSAVAEPREPGRRDRPGARGAASRDGVRRHRPRHLPAARRARGAPSPTCGRRSACIRTTHRSWPANGTARSARRTADRGRHRRDRFRPPLRALSPADEQETAFRAQIRLAHRLGRALGDPLRAMRGTTRSACLADEGAHRADGVPLLHRRARRGAPRRSTRARTSRSADRVVQDADDVRAAAAPHAARPAARRDRRARTSRRCPDGDARTSPVSSPWSARPSPAPPGSPTPRSPSGPPPTPPPCFRERAADAAADTGERARLAGGARAPTLRGAGSTFWPTPTLPAASCASPASGPATVCSRSARGWDPSHSRCANASARSSPSRSIPGWRAPSSEMADDPDVRVVAGDALAVDLDAMLR